jgi:hypothetical protein
VKRRTFLSAVAGASIAATRRARSQETESGAMNEALDARARSWLAEWDRLPEHRTGTPGDRATADWLFDELTACGGAPTLEPFAFARLDPGACWLECEGERVDGVPCFDGGRTGAAAVTAALGTATGIAVVDVAPSGSAELEALRRRGAHAAIVAIAAGSATGTGLTLLNADAYRKPYGPPVLQVAGEHRARIAHAATAQLPARIRIDATVAHTTAFNVAARIDGRRPELAPLVVMTPRSGWWRCTSERGGGVVAFLECAKRFAAARPERTVLFTANTGHELGHLGLDAFVDAQPALLGGAHAWLHLGANFAARGGRVRVQASQTDWLDALRGELTARGPACDVTPVGTRPLGEARNVFDAGGRFVSILGSNPFFHHPDDRWPDAVDVGVTTAATTALVAVAERLARA